MVRPVTISKITHLCCINYVNSFQNQPYQNKSVHVNTKSSYSGLKNTKHAKALRDGHISCLFLMFMSLLVVQSHCMQRSWSQDTFMKSVRGYRGSLFILVGQLESAVCGECTTTALCHKTLPITVQKKCTPVGPMPVSGLFCSISSTVFLCLLQVEQTHSNQATQLVGYSHRGIVICIIQLCYNR